MSVDIRTLTGPEFSLLAPTLVDIYVEAMGYPASIRDQRIAVWRRDIACHGFRALIAVEKTGRDERDERIVGVAYGFAGERGRWWDQQLIRGLKAAGRMTPDTAKILEDYFELAEVHVASPAQGRGIGRALVTALVQLTNAEWVLLSTPEVREEANAAFGLYRSLGFRDILRDYTYPGDDRPFAVLGRRLPLETAG